VGAESDIQGARLRGRTLPTLTAGLCHGMPDCPREKSGAQARVGAHARPQRCSDPYPPSRLLRLLLEHLTRWAFVGLSPDSTNAVKVSRATKIAGNMFAESTPDAVVKGADEVTAVRNVSRALQAAA
jgi:hypothetical protein